MTAMIVAGSAWFAGAAILWFVLRVYFDRADRDPDEAMVCGWRIGVSLTWPLFVVVFGVAILYTHIRLRGARIRFPVPLTPDESARAETYKRGIR